MKMFRSHQANLLKKLIFFPLSNDHCYQPYLELPFKNLSSIVIAESSHKCICGKCWKNLFDCLIGYTSLKKLRLSFQNTNENQRTGILDGLKNMKYLEKLTVEIISSHLINKQHTFVDFLSQLSNIVDSFSLYFTYEGAKNTDDEILARILQGLNNPKSLSLRFDDAGISKSNKQICEKNLTLEEISKLIKRTNIQSLKIKRFSGGWLFLSPNLLSLGEALKESRSLKAFYLQLTTVNKNYRGQFQNLMSQISQNQSIEELRLSDSPLFSQQNHTIYQVPQKLQILEIQNMWINFSNLPESLQTLTLKLQQYDNSSKYVKQKMITSLKQLQIEVLEESPFPQFIQMFFPSIEKLTINIEQPSDKKLIEYLNQNHNLQEVVLNFLQPSHSEDLLQLFEALDPLKNITSLELAFLQINFLLKIGPLPKHLNHFKLKVNQISKQQIEMFIESFASWLAKNSTLISFHLQLMSDSIQDFSCQNLPISQFSQLFENPSITDFKLEILGPLPKGLDLLKKLVSCRLSAILQAIVFKKQIEHVIPFNPTFCFSDLYLA